MTDRISQRVERIAMVSEPLCPCQVKRSEEREFYLRMAAGQRWSVREVTPISDTDSHPSGRSRRS